MSGEMIPMGIKDLRRFKVVDDLIGKKIPMGEACEVLRLSRSQVKRIRRRVRALGPKGVLHGLRGKLGNRHLAFETKSKILDLWASKYSKCGFNLSHFTQMLNETENTIVSRESVRKLLRKEGLVTTRKRQRQHRKFRERRESFGELLQQDTSPHDWLGIGSKQQKISIIDDATSTLLYSQLFPHDGSLSNMRALESVFQRYGLPQSIYVDRASWFFYSKKTNVSCRFEFLN